MDLDMKDRRIIASLDMDARTPINALASSVRLSREVTEYRIKRMEKKGVIFGYHAVFDMDVIGYRSFRILLRLYNLPQQKRNELMSYFCNHKSTWWVASVGGKWDIVLNFIAKDTAEFNEIFEDIIAKYGQHLQRYEVLIYIGIRDHSRSYMLNKPNSREFHHKMKYNEKAILDEADRRIAALIAKNARMTYTEIGEHIGLTRNAVKVRMQRLEKEGLILGYRTSIHPTSLGYSSYLLLLAINNLKGDRERQLQEYARQHPNIVFTVKHLGKYRISLECECRGEREFHTLLSGIRDKFDDILIDFEFFPIFFDHKISYFPLP